MADNGTKPMSKSALYQEISTKTNLTRKFIYAKLAAFRRRELPELFLRWQADSRDPSVPHEFKREFRQLEEPEAVTPRVQDDRQPEIDDAFRGLGIVR